MIERPAAVRPAPSRGRRRVVAAAWTFALLAAGCAVGPDFTPPDPEAPAGWNQPLEGASPHGDPAELAAWWTGFGDPLLDQLVAEADAGNLDLAAALARIDEARAVLRVDTGAFFPDIDATGSYARTRTSKNLGIPGTGGITDVYAAGLEASWEIDLFGRIRRGVEAAQSELQAAVDDYHGVRVVLQSEVAAAYVDIRTLQQRMAYAQSNIDTQRSTLQLTRDRFETGVAPGLDVSQAESNLAVTESLMPQLREQFARSLNGLAVLLGRHPGEVIERLAVPAPIPAPPEALALGFPAEVLRQRPDVRAAEQRLAAQTARIGQASAELYPRLTLSGFFGRAASSSSDLHENSSKDWSFVPGLRWNLFDGGRVRGVIQIEDARASQALARWQRTVLDAIADVEDALAAFAQEQRRRDALQRSVDASERSVDYSKTLYTNGLVNFQSVLDSERGLFDQQDALARSRGLVTRNVIALYRALGGGWQAELAGPAADETAPPVAARPAAEPAVEPEVLHGW